jgi:type II secretory pathway component GspD/PulD (secretin)
MKRSIPEGRHVLLLILISTLFFSTWLLVAAYDDPANDPAPSEPAQVAQTGESFDTLLEQRKAAELTEYLKKAKEYYDNAEFTFALINYERALRLDKGNVGIQQLIEECRLRQAQQKELLANIPSEMTREDYVKEKYKEAGKLYGDHAYKEAKEAFEQIWMLAGDYRATRKYLTRIKDRLATSETRIAATPSPSMIIEEAKEKAAEETRQAIASHLEKSKASFEEAQFSTAKAEVQQVLAVDPKNKEARKLEKKIDAALEQARVAEAERQEAERNRKEQEAQQAMIANLLERGRTLQADGNFQDAIAEYEKILAIDKKNKEAKQAIAQAKDGAAAAEKEQKRAQQEAERRERAAPLVAEGNELLQAEKFEQAIKKYKAALDIDAENAGAATQLAVAQEAIASREAAAKLAEEEKRRAEAEAREKAKRDAAIDAHLKTAEKLLARKKYQEAVAEAKQALELDPANADTNAFIAKAEQAAAQEQEKLAREREQKENQEKITAHLRRAKDLLGQKSYDDAIAEYEAVLKLDETNATAQAGIQDARRDLAKVEKAKEEERQKAEAEKAKAQEEAKHKEIADHLSKAKELLDAKSYEEAVAEFEAILKLDPTNRSLAEALAGIQEAREGLAKVEEAKTKEEKKQNAEAEKAKSEEEAKQKEISVHLSKGKELLGEKRYEEAIVEFEALLKLDAKSTEALACVQNAREGMAKLEEAKAKEEEETKKVEEEKAKLEKAEAEKEAKQKEIEALEKESLDKAKRLTDEGIGLFEAEKYDEALERFNEALAVEPLYSEAVDYKNRAEQALATKRQEEEAKLAEQRRLEEAKLSSDNLTAGARQLFDEGNYDEAEAKLKQALELFPENEAAKTLLEQVGAKKEQQRAQLVQNKLADGDRLYKEGAYKLALEKFQEVLQSDPENAKASRYIQLCNEKIEEQRMAAEKVGSKQRAERAEELFKEGLAAYGRKDIETAVSKWREALAANPDHLQAQTYLEQTRDEYERFMAHRKETEEFDAKEKAAQKKLDQPVTISTTETTDLKEFLRTLSLATGINFYVAEGVEASVFAKFDDIPLREILDAILVPIGLKWSRKPGTDIITVTMDLQMKVFPLTPEELTKVRAMMEAKFIQKILWPPDATPKVKGVELRLDERESLLISTDSRSNIAKLDGLLKDLKQETPPSLVYRSYTIRPELGPKIKALIEGMLQAESRAPYSKERKLLISDGELIVKDTPENVQKIEELLQDKKFIDKLREDVIRVETYNIAPQWIEKNPEQVQQFGDYVVEVIETMLYSKTGRSAARQEGRRLWYDRSTMQLTVTDYPDNLKAVSKFLASLPLIEKRRKSEIIFLKHAKATDLADQLREVLGLTAPSERAAGGLSVTKSLRVEDTMEFRDLQLRVVRVNENNVNDKLDDSVELVVNTPTSSQDMTIEEFRSEFIDDYEISAPDIRPSGTPGEGRAKITVRYLPPPGAPQAPPEATPTPTAEAAAEVGLDIHEIETLNALLIRYDDPAKFAEVAEWIERLDVPVLQVSIEVRFVEVIESRAKEYSSEFTMLNLGQGVDLDSSLFNMRFAQDLDEFRSEFEPGVESSRGANLLKGTTIFNWIVAGGESPINYQLRTLEAEGIINVASSPNILVLNGETATFRIERQLGLPQVDAQGNFIGGVGITRIDQVDLDVSPTVTQLGSIMLEISADIYDFDQSLGTLTSTVRPGMATGPIAVYQGTYDLGLLHKEIDTIARLTDGQTIVLGGWAGERSGEYTSGVPLLRNLPYLGRLLFGRNLNSIEKTTLLIFLTGRIVD